MNKNNLALLLMMVAACGNAAPAGSPDASVAQQCNTNELLPARIRVERPTFISDASSPDQSVVSGAFVVGSTVYQVIVKARLGQLGKDQQLDLSLRPLPIAIAVVGSKGFLASAGAVTVNGVCATGIALTLNNVSFLESQDSKVVEGGCAFSVPTSKIALGDCAPQQ
jgi:hypothetical protein